MSSYEDYLKYLHHVENTSEREIKEKIRSLNDSISKLNTSVITLTKDKADLTVRLSQMQKAVSSKTDEVESQKITIEGINEVNAAFKCTIDTLTKEKEGLRNELDTAKKEINYKNTEINQLRDALAIEIEGLKSELDNAKNEINNKITEINQLKRIIEHKGNGHTKGFLKKIEVLLEKKIEELIEELQEVEETTGENSFKDSRGIHNSVSFCLLLIAAAFFIGAFVLSIIRSEYINALPFLGGIIAIVDIMSLNRSGLWCSVVYFVCCFKMCPVPWWQLIISLIPFGLIMAALFLKERKVGFYRFNEKKLNYEKHRRSVILLKEMRMSTSITVKVDIVVCLIICCIYIIF